MRNKKILIVGGASGIGLSIANLALEQGAQVVIASRSIEKMEAAARQLKYPVGIEVVDACSDASVSAFFSRVGTFDHMAVTIKPNLPSGAFLDNDIATVQAAFDTKFWGQYRLVKTALRCINAGGSIVLSSGIAAHRSYQGYSVVSAMNAATEALVKAIALEAAPVRVNVVCLCFVDAAKLGDDRLSYAQAVGAQFPLRRLGRVDEIASAYIHFFHNTYASGSCLVVDGATSC